MDQAKYNISLDTKFRHLELIDVPAVVAACKEKWQNFTLTQVNDSVMHRPRAPKKTVMLMVETAEIVPTGD